MRKIFLFILLLTALSTTHSQEKFVNPILAGFYPDPSICKVGGDYYIVNSTFAYFPGIPVFHSKDLVNWKLIGHVLDRPEQLNLDGFGVSRAVFAPAIEYNKGKFYVTSTIVDGGGNFIVSADKPEGPWTNPVWLPEINGIDPSLFFDDNGRAYITYNSDAPNNKPLYDGHRTVRMVEFDIINLKVISEPIILVDGGVDISKKPVWIEGPHIYKINGTYFLNAAEGGTAEDHSQVIFKSDKVDGPYIPYEKNPILTQKHLDPNRKFPVTCTGHADFVRTDEGSWWAVFLACRPHNGNYYTGRETFLAPIKWIDGWPVINPDYEEVQYYYPLPIKQTSGKVDIPYSGNFTLRDEFDKEQLHPSWIFLRTPHEMWYNLNSKKGYLAINLRPETCSGKLNPSFIARRQQHNKGYASTSVLFNPLSENEKAGLIVFLNETCFYYLCKSVENGKPVIQLFRSLDKPVSDNEMELIKQIDYTKLTMNGSVNLKIETNGDHYSFYYSLEKEDWKFIEKLDAPFLRVQIPRDFTGCVFAMYATSLGKQSTNKAYFDWFEYYGNDDVYKSK
ncbi:MAG: glycoside hydrolase family 43 protein [Bacteroidota bacterium]|jgi:alpha-N-arabinofuranosidase